MLSRYLSTEILLKVCLSLSLVGLFGGKFIPPQFYRYALTVALVALLIDAFRSSTGARAAIANPFVWLWLLVLLTLALSMTQLMYRPELSAEYRIVFHAKTLLYSATLLWLFSTTIRCQKDLTWALVPMLFSLTLVLVDFVLRFGTAITDNQVQMWVSARYELALKVTLLILFVPPSLFYFTRIRDRIAIGVLGLFSILLLFALGMRSGWILAIGLVLLWVALRPKLAVVLIPLSAAATALLVWLAPIYAIERLHHGLHDLGERPIYVWLPTLKMISSRPWQGFGYGGHYAETLREHLHLTPGGNALIQNLHDAHNFYLQMTWHGGALTITALLVAICYLFWCLVREFQLHIRLDDHSPQKLLYVLVWSLLVLWGGIIANSETPDIFSFSVLFGIAAVWRNVAHNTIGKP